MTFLAYHDTYLLNQFVPVVIFIKYRFKFMYIIITENASRASELPAHRCALHELYTYHTYGLYEQLLTLCLDAILCFCSSCFIASGIIFS